MNLVLGGGLTGITAAYTAFRGGREVTTLEADSQAGGASRTLTFGDGWRYDLGGHRLYTRLPDVLSLVHDLIGDDLIEVERRSRIYLNGRFADYPLTFGSAVSALGPLTTVQVAASYLAGRLRRLVGGRPAVTFEDWVVERFGRKLYEIYFKPYSEKVWGVNCSELSADFAAQRIKGLSMREALKKMFTKGEDGPATLTTRFLYPRYGFGRIHETMIERMPEGAVRTGCPVEEVRHDGGRIMSVRAGQIWRDPERVVSTMPITDLVRMMSPAAPADVINAADGLRFRDLIVVFLALDRERVTDDHWIYLSSGDLRLGRVHEPKNWSSHMAPAGKTGLVAELFCFRDEPVWEEDDKAIVALASGELSRIGLIEPGEVIGAEVVRVTGGYPIYDDGYEERLGIIRDYVEQFDNLTCAGRSGCFRYTSGDYCIEMGIRAGENVLGASHDIFAIGSTQEYAENGSAPKKNSLTSG